MKKAQVENKDLIKNSLIAGLIGFFSVIFAFTIFDGIAEFFRFGKFIIYTSIFFDSSFYIKSIVVGLIFFLFFYLTLKYKEHKIAKIIMWLGIIGYSILYLGYLFLLFFFQFKDL